MLWLETTSSSPCVAAGVLGKKRSMIFSGLLGHCYKNTNTDTFLHYLIRTSCICLPYHKCRKVLIFTLFLVFVFDFFLMEQQCYTKKYISSSRFWFGFFLWFFYVYTIVIWNYYCKEYRTYVTKLSAERGFPNFVRIHKIPGMKSKIMSDISNQIAFSVPPCVKKEALLTSREQWAEIKKYWNVEEQEVKQKGENYLGHYVDEKKGELSTAHWREHMNSKT